MLQDMCLPTYHARDRTISFIVYVQPFHDHKTDGQEDRHDTQNIS